MIKKRSQLMFHINACLGNWPFMFYEKQIWAIILSQSLVDWCNSSSNAKFSCDCLEFQHLCSFFPNPNQRLEHLATQLTKKASMTNQFLNILLTFVWATGNFQTYSQTPAPTLTNFVQQIHSQGEIESPSRVPRWSRCYFLCKLVCI